VGLRTLGVVLAILGGLVGLATPAAAAQGDPPRLDVTAAEAALATQQVYRAPGAIADYDQAAVRAVMVPKARILLAPFSGEEDPNAYDDRVLTPLTDWSRAHDVDLIVVTGLHVEGLDVGAESASDLSELRSQLANQDVTNGLVGLLTYFRTGNTHYDSPPAPAPTPPSAAQLAPVLAALQAGQNYTAPGATPLDVDPAGTGYTLRSAAFPPAAVGAALVDYAPALARALPGVDVVVGWGGWIQFAGPHTDQLGAALAHTLGQRQVSVTQAGATATVLADVVTQYVSTMLRAKPFDRPQPPPYDLRHQVSALAPWVLLGAAVLLGGGSLLAWRRRRAAAQRAERVAWRRESGLATAALAELGARLLDAADRPAEDAAAVAAAAERQATAQSLFDQARTAEAMRAVRAVAEEGEAAVPR
jgi:hypothetical protein